MQRSERKRLAEETLQILGAGRYVVGRQLVEIAEAVKRCVDGTEWLTADQLVQLREKVLARPNPAYHTQIEVANETTLAGLHRLGQQSEGPIAVLNFASAKNPGGGFLNGSQAQEESLARSSALYASQQRVFGFYEKHRGLTSCLYTHDMIWSPDCPIIRRDDGQLLTQPELASFITSPAPNAGAVAQNTPEEVPLIEEVLRTRSELVLALAAAKGCQQIILGAWGCGVFRNEPKLVAEVFATHLHGRWSGRFQHVLFSVLDHSSPPVTYQAFASRLA